jgi:hypothetical protein
MQVSHTRASLAHLKARSINALCPYRPLHLKFSVLKTCLKCCPLVSYEESSSRVRHAQATTPTLRETQLLNP